jgi:hypothetical protein
MMMRRLNMQVEWTVAAVLLVLASAANAGPTSEWRYIDEFQPAVSTAGLATTRFQAAGGLGASFDTSSWNRGTGSAADASTSLLTLDAQTAAASTAQTSVGSDGRMRVLAASSTPSNTSPVVGSPAALDLTLWNFIRNIRAQQLGNPFTTLQTSSANIDYTLNAVPAPVPLPPASWLFAAGIAALVGGRLLLRAMPGRSASPRPELA